MKNAIRCSDIMTSVVMEATSQFAPLWKINPESFDILKQYCDVIDRISEEFDGEAIEIKVDEVSHLITIELECPDMVIDSRNHLFYKLSERAVAFGFSVTGAGLLSIKFVFPSLWEKCNIKLGF